MFNTVDAAALAAQFATLEVSAPRERYSERTDRIDDQRVGLNSLKTALSSFESSLATIRNNPAPLLSSSATTSDPSFFDVDVGENALETSYEIFSQQLAQRHTIANSTTSVDGSGSPVSGSSTLPDFGIISIALNDANGMSRIDTDGAPIAPITVDLAMDLPPSSTLKDLVDFVNTSSANPGVTLSLVNSNGQVSLMTSSQISGTNANLLNSFTEDGLDPDPTANDWLQSLFSMNASSELAAPKNAIMKLGNELTGLTVESETNTFDNVFDDVSITLKQAMPSGNDTVELVIAADKSATRSKLTNIVESYNSLMDNFDFLLAAGGEESDRGSLADFAAVKSMKRQITNQFRSEYNGSTLFSVGLEIDSKGKMLLNSSRFDQTYDQTPEIFDSIIKADNGLLDQVDEIVGSFTGITGSVQTKLDYTQQQLDLIDQKLVNLDNQYERQFQRYLQQFTSLNAVIDQMNSTSGLFAF